MWGNMFPSVSAPNPKTVIRERLAEIIRRAFGMQRFAAEKAARASSRTPRCTKNWLAGKNVPDSAALIELMASSDALSDEVMALVHERRKAREGR
ncbi:hypothetical protein Geu3261_0025_005 [Komagataeibacter europaeus NBRC 3261]|uniref:HTH cro/C1-type domain-containing protein n=1 Tax=Komagataeibacter europaeus NBRC 3261 TaxID=1234669 RepID=A0A0D6PW96_KOMEU|nr:hypothetical protein Geu3261_0025_005 [Komagataeibacter europaeus NBRC 3261]